MSLPLLTLGLSGRVSGWLLDAGISIRPIETTAVRRGIAPSGEDRSIVLFDSRNASARTDAEAAQALGYETIDVARLLAVRPVENNPELTVMPAADPRRRFFDELRPAIEHVGGLWIRLADFPYPYRWAVCRESNTNESNIRELNSTVATFDRPGESLIAVALSAFAELPTGNGPSGRLSADDWLAACALAGRPVRFDEDNAATIARATSKNRVSPLTWTTTLAEFADWWRLRRRLRLSARCLGRCCQIELDVLHDPVSERMLAPVEIWRGRHVAIVPVRAGRRLQIDDSLPFQLNTTRHPAGFTAEATDAECSAFSERSMALTAT